MLPRSTTYKSSCHKGSETLCGVCVASLMEGLNDGGTDDDCMMQMLAPGSMSRKSYRKHGKSVYEITQQPTSDKLTFGFFVFKKTTIHSAEKMPVGKKQKIATAIFRCSGIANSLVSSIQENEFKTILVNPMNMVSDPLVPTQSHVSRKVFDFFLTRIDVYVS